MIRALHFNHESGKKKERYNEKNERKRERRIICPYRYWVSTSSAKKGIVECRRTVRKGNTDENERERERIDEQPMLRVHNRPLPGVIILTDDNVDDDDVILFSLGATHIERALGRTVFVTRSISTIITVGLHGYRTTGSQGYSIH